MQKSIIALFAFVSSAMAVQYSIAVGGSGLTFVRDALTAQVGDTVKFVFNGNHSVAQSTYDKPCVPSDHAPVFSGVIEGPSPDSTDAVNPTWTLDLKNNGTLWLYSSVADDCQKSMSAMIIVGNNPDPDQTLTKYQAAAALVSASVAPDTVEGGTLGTTAGPSDGGSSASSSASSSGIVTVVSGSTTSTTTALSTTVTSKASTVTATKSGAESGHASATSTSTPVTATGAAGKQAQIPIAFGLAGIAGGLAALMA
ncbi:hypothetical protein SBOR_8669 [Sclerotinia borealis F-4128]|uniref:Extracellular serine-rich protein n=1 Tax=Sclerotinia borealis (strain F-4128) TaxID=1432307 RepID=W9C500_SCLBF|nr:hypothetical protein SBOR_8669 [Sclerotinia borealis F-4128]